MPQTIERTAPPQARRAAIPPAPVLRCFNVKYSPNLGDGLLSECLERALVAEGADPATGSIDLAARRAYGDGMAGRGPILAALGALPGPLRRLAVRAPLALAARTRWRPYYAAGLSGADGVVIGGGNLLSDVDLNFPTKLSLAIGEAVRRGLPVAIYGCGMAGGWSRAGLERLRSALARADLRAVFLRDAWSKDHWDRLMAPETGIVAEVVRDPGLMARDLYAPAPKPPGARPVAGLGLMSPVALRYHGAGAFGDAPMDDWYEAVARGLIAAGLRVRVFTNGAPEDRAFAAAMQGRLRALGGEEDIAFATQRDPAGLCAHLSQVDVLIAHRMHAIIAAYSYGVPAVALGWDRKVDSFMASVGRPEWVADAATTRPGAVVEMAVATRKAGLDADVHASVLTEARHGVAALLAALRDDAQGRGAA